MKILILGGTGLVGSFIRNSSLADEFRLIIHGHENKSDVNCDMTNINEMYNLLSKDKYEIILNLVAQTDVDKCEQDASASFNYNIKTAHIAEGPGGFVEAVVNYRKKWVFIKLGRKIKNI